MRIKIKVFHNDLKKKYTENHFMLKRKFKKIWDEILEKGHEKMTVMFIPHNEKRIFNFHISKFTVLFFILLFLMVVITSSYAVYKNAAVTTQKDQLLNNYKDIRSHLLRFEILTNKTADVVDEIKPEVEDIYELAKGDNNTGKIWDYEMDDPNNINKMKTVLPEEIYTLRELEKDLLCTMNTIKTVKNFVDVRSKVINDVPSVIPNKGHISSLFGWRRSPFGFGRDFHTGIDIAASPGIEIRATAPGLVESAGWCGGYGFMVKIKHKYGFESIYGHCKSISVHMGDYVKKGQIVGYVGQTGSATGNHCHYEIRLGNVAINPYPYMSRIW